MVLPHMGMSDDPVRPEDLVHLRAFRVAANVVHSHLLDLLLNERRTFGSGVGAPTPIKRMMLVSERYSPNAAGELDSSGSTSEDLSLASELRSLVVHRLNRQTDFDMAVWAKRALAVIERAEQPDARAQDLAAEREFAEEELLPVLETIADLPPERITE